MSDTLTCPSAAATRRPIVAGNWKMHGSPEKIQLFARYAANSLQADLGVDVALFPPVALITMAHEQLGTQWAIGAQDCHWQQSGAFTGENSPELLYHLGCQYVLIGHSERRTLMGETDEYIHSKILGAFNTGLIPVLCIGETLESYQAEETYITLASQLYNGLPSAAAKHEIVIAYEPVWAIGSGLTPTAEEVQNCHDHIRTFLCTHWNHNKAESTRILYGGSVKAGNAHEFMSLKDVDGVLVGGASLDAEEFCAIISHSK